MVEGFYTLHVVSHSAGMLGREDFCILSCLLVDFLFHHKTLDFPLRREFRDLPEGLDCVLVVFRHCLMILFPLLFTRATSPQHLPFQHFTTSRLSDYSS